ncbi:MAG: DegV family protein [Acidimicrobiales bacterium]|nr:DegV family protein [Acidimicrobiales bacterium]
MAGIQVVTDSGSDIPPQLAKDLGITIVSLSVRFGNDEVVDTVSLTPDEFWSRCAALAAPAVPETAAPSPGAFQEAYLKAHEEGFEGVVVVTLSSEVSSTYQSALQAKELVADKIPVEVVDSRNVSAGEGLVAIAAAEYSKSGASLEEVKKLADDVVDRTFGAVAVDTLENLRRGGRISNGSAFVGSLLSIKPVVEVREGKIESESKHRTRGRSLDYLAQRVNNYGEFERFAFLNGGAKDFDVFKDKVLAQRAIKDPIFADIGPIIGTHLGLGAVGIAFTVAPKGSDENKSSSADGEGSDSGK